MLDDHKVLIDAVLITGPTLVLAFFTGLASHREAQRMRRDERMAASTQDRNERQMVRTEARDERLIDKLIRLIVPGKGKANDAPSSNSAERDRSTHAGGSVARAGRDLHHPASYRRTTTRPTVRRRSDRVRSNN